jgi:hypothetical protein
MQVKEFFMLLSLVILSLVINRASVDLRAQADMREKVISGSASTDLEAVAESLREDGVDGHGGRLCLNVLLPTCIDMLNDTRYKDMLFCEEFCWNVLRACTVTQ